MSDQNPPLDGRQAGDVPLPGGSFQLFIHRLAYQLMMSCGRLENPITGTRDVNVQSATMVLADLEMLQEKTRGNLEDEEEEHLNKVLAELSPLVKQLGKL